MTRSFERYGVCWILHDDENGGELEAAQAEQSMEIRDHLFDKFRGYFPEEEPPTVRFSRSTKAVEYRPEAPQPFVLVDVSVQGRPTLAKCQTLVEAEELGAAPGAWA